MVLPHDLPNRIENYQKEPTTKNLEDILILIDRLILRMIHQIRKKKPYLNIYDITELYNTAILATINVCRRYKIYNERSIYSFPRYLKSYILEEFHATFKMDYHTTGVETPEFEVVTTKMAMQRNMVDRIAKRDFVIYRLLQDKFTSTDPVKEWVNSEKLQELRKFSRMWDMAYRHYGLGETYIKIAEDYGISKARVSQVIQRYLKIMRGWLQRTLV